MPASSASGPTLTCSQCGYVNEPERVYCHNCGAKLDRSSLPKEDPKKRESIEETRRRVRRMTNPDPNPVGNLLKSAVKVLFWAAVVACLILILQPPADLPKTSDTMARVVSSELADAVESPQPRTIVFTEEDVNNYLRSKKVDLKSWIPGVKLRRLYVRFEPNSVRVGIERSLYGYSLFSDIRHQINVQDGKLVANQTGGRFGRLAIHPQVMGLGGIFFDSLWAGLKRERDQMDQMREITVEEGKITFTTKGKGA